jgi:hypothetical protein
MRFINNSKKHINCYPKKVFCNTVQRIGMYAKRDIKAVKNSTSTTAIQKP